MLLAPLLSAAPDLITHPVPWFPLATFSTRLRWHGGLLAHSRRRSFELWRPPAPLRLTPGPVSFPDSQPLSSSVRRRNNKEIPALFLFVSVVVLAMLHFMGTLCSWKIGMVKQAHPHPHSENGLLQRNVLPHMT